MWMVILCLRKEVTKVADGGKVVEVVYVDINKAFNVLHGWLLWKVTLHDIKAELANCTRCQSIVSPL